LRDTRNFRTDDRSQVLTGSGQIDFDARDGLVKSRVFRGTYTLHGLVTQISLKIDRLGDQQLRELR
jgi:hypothetical protein